jgi:sec-independent protein translocase protein TatB
MAGRSLIGFIQNFGGGEILVILLAALVILGPDRLPEVGRSIGRAIHKARTMTSGVESQVRDVIDDPAMQSIRELGEFAARPRQKLAQYALEAEAEARAQAAPVEPPAVDLPAAEAPAVEAPTAEALPVDPAPVTSAPEKPLDIRGD